jgi:hypothetical protein
MWSIGQLWRHPTKSMLGEQVDTVTLARGGSCRGGSAGGLKAAGRHLDRAKGTGGRQ